MGVSQGRKSSSQTKSRVVFSRAKQEATRKLIARNKKRRFVSIKRVLNSPTPLALLIQTILFCISVFSYTFSQKKRRSLPKRFFPWMAMNKTVITISGSITLIAGIFLLYQWFLTLPNPALLTTRPIAQSTIIYDRNGKELYRFYATENRTIVPLSRIPKTLIDATFAIEDKNFYSHPGFDLFAILRAVVSNSKGNALQGGSTLTQQLIKSALLSPQQQLTRKMKEIILAFWTEKMYSKNQILTMYFNQIPYGGTAWGVEAAAEVYFDKDVKDLDLAESAFLAGITSAPSYYSPFGNTPTLWKTRQKEVLTRMKDLNYISQDQYTKAVQENLTFHKQDAPLLAPHFVAYIKDLLINTYGLAAVEKGGLHVTTTLDSAIQQKAQDIVHTTVQSDAYLNLTNGAAVITNPTNGDILAMVGSQDYTDPNGGSVNLATSLRQPGSTVKVITYAAALSHGLTAASILDDSPTSFGIPGSTPYAPVNYDGKFHGKVPLRFALANSFNIPAVKTLNQVGIPTMVNLGKDMGASNWGDPSQYGLSITLGSAELTMLDLDTVFSTLANQGNKVHLNPILKITNSSGQTVAQKHISAEPVLDSGVAYILSDILSDNNARTMEFGPNSPLVIPGHTVSVKTGTSDDKRDNWTVGYTKDYVVTVWVGNNNGAPMNPILASGITGAAPIWHDIMSYLLGDKPDQKHTPPATIVSVPCGGRQELFLRGTEQACNAYPAHAGASITKQ
jgi:penicillin-binding protein 1C